MLTPNQFAELQRIAHELVDAERMPCWSQSEIEKRAQYRENALKAMRMIGLRTPEKIGQPEDWGT